MMTTKGIQKNEQPTEEAAKKITFRCKSCGQFKPIDEMKIITRFFPLLVVCSKCEREML